MRASAALVVALAALAGCQPDESLARMIHQRRAQPFDESDLFADGAAMRRPPEGTVPRGESAPRPRDDASTPRALLARGRDRFGIICATCHGLDGRAGTVVAERMKLRRPPSLLEERIRALPLVEIETTIETGAGLMPGFAGDLPAGDRRAVAAYVRALQIAGGTRLEDLPPARRAGAVSAHGERAP